MSPRSFAFIVGAAALVVGLILGLRTHTALAQYEGQRSCGSTMFPNTDEAKHADAVGSFLGGNGHESLDACEKVLGSPAIAWTLTGVGVVVLIGAAAIRPATRRPTAA